MSDLRVVIKATVELRSALHVGCGAEAPVADRLLAVLNSRLGKAYANFDACRDELNIAETPKGRYQRTYRVLGQAAIPASSFRALWRRAISQPDLVNRYFGPLTKPGQHLSAGWLRIADLRRCADSPALSADRHPLPDDEAGTAVTQGIGMEPITGTVSEHLLWSYEYAPPGTRFSLSAEIVPPAGTLVLSEDLAILTDALQRIGQTPALALGRGTGKGMGLLQVTINEVRGIDGGALQAWLERGQGRLIDVAGAHRKLADRPSAPRDPSTARLDLRFPFGVLTSDPFLARPKPRSTHTDDRRGSPETAQHQYTRDAAGLPMLRGSSLRGLLRSHATRIVASQLLVYGCPVTAAPTRAREAIDELFGRTSRKGALAVSDARCVDQTPVVARWRSFVAVDRFTGGAAAQKLYDALAANACTLRCDISPLRDLVAWERGLLLHVLRDALDGDLAIGWGKSRGLGAVQLHAARVGSATVNNASELRALVGNSVARQNDLAAFDETMRHRAQTAIAPREASHD